MHIGSQQGILVTVVGYMKLEESSGQTSGGEGTLIQPFDLPACSNLAASPCWSTSDPYPQSTTPPTRTVVLLLGPWNPVW